MTFKSDQQKLEFFRIFCDFCKNCFFKLENKIGIASYCPAEINRFSVQLPADLLTQAVADPVLQVRRVLH